MSALGYFVFLANCATGLPADVDAALQSFGRWPRLPHRKQQPSDRCLLPCCVGLLSVAGRLLAVAIGATCSCDAISDIAPWLRTLRSMVGLRATASLCCMSYDVATSHPCVEASAMTNSWWAAKFVALDWPWWWAILALAACAARCQSAIDINFSLRLSSPLATMAPCAFRTNSSSPLAALIRAAGVRALYGTYLKALKASSTLVGIAVCWY